VARVSETAFDEFSLDAQFRYDADALEKRIAEVRPAVTILCLPNNPTGSELEPDRVDRIAQAAEAAGGILLVDEAYREFSGEAFDRGAIARTRENVILVRTYSKAFSGAGLRIGYLLTSRPLGRELGKIVPPFHLSVFTAVAGSILWDERKHFMAQVARIVQERERLRGALAQIGLEALPSAANFFLMRVPDGPAVFAALKKRGILVRTPGDDPALAGCLRVNVGTPEEDDRLVAALREILAPPQKTRKGGKAHGT